VVARLRFTPESVGYFSQGTIELDARGRDVFQQSFVGVAFHRRDDNMYEAVYLRPFNFRATDPVRHMHAVPVDSSISPTAWVRLRVVVDGRTIHVFVGDSKAPALEVRKLGALDRGMVGLWTGNGSDGDFANLRITPKK
jgi:hypothetical protein